MRVTILMGSPNQAGNTAALVRPFMDEMRKLGAEQELLRLYEMNIQPCRGERYCQNVQGEPECVISGDDFSAVLESVLNCNVLVLATPIHSWYCTSPMKAVMDRLIFSCCRYYGKERRSSALKGKYAVSLATCGYPVSAGTDVWDLGLQHWCKHGKMEYLGMKACRDTGDPTRLLDETAELEVREFARWVYCTVSHDL